jgi:glucokinase
MPKMTTTDCAIGVDAGGTKCAAGLVSLSDGVLVAREIRQTLPDRGGAAVLDDVIELVGSMQETSRQASLGVVSVGIGICELVSPTGEILSEATIRWKSLSVVARICEAAQLPVVLEADVRAAARAEARHGAGQDFGSFLYVTVGTGISASLVMNGEPYVGARGLTGTFASSRGLIPGDHAMLLSGPPLEEFAAGPAIAARFSAVRPDFAGAAPDVLALAMSGDAEAQAVIESAGQALGAAIAQLVNIVDPEAIVIGGGLGSVEGLYRQSILATLREYIWSDQHRDIRLLSARLGNNAGVIGAAMASASSVRK